MPIGDYEMHFLEDFFQSHNHSVNTDQNEMEQHYTINYKGYDVPIVAFCMSIVKSFFLIGNKCGAVSKKPPKFSGFY